MRGKVYEGRATQTTWSSRGKDQQTHLLIEFGYHRVQLPYVRDHGQGAAAQHVPRETTTRGDGTGLGVATKKSGCTGVAHVVDYAGDIDSDDQVLESQGMQIVVDAHRLPNLDGMAIGFVKSNLLIDGLGPTRHFAIFAIVEFMEAQAAAASGEDVSQAAS